MNTTTATNQPKPAARGKGPLIITVLVLLLLIVHQDNWFWDDGTLVFGFLPVGLLWHAGISVAASAVWLLATQIAWPLDHDRDHQESR